MNTMSNFIKTALLTFIFFTTAASAQTTLEDGIEAYDAENYEKSLSIFKPLAIQGDMEAQSYLGQQYQLGEAVEQSYEESFKWYIKAADQGDYVALYTIAEYYKDGTGVEQSWSKAFRFYEMAAKEGDDTSQYYMGYMYENGYGVAQSYENAAEWYKKSADLGDPDAQGYLAELFQNGKGVEQNHTLAISYYLQAISQDNDYAKEQLKDLIVDNSPEVQKRSQAFLMVAKLFRDGNEDEAIQLWNGLAEKGDSYSQTTLATIYEKGSNGISQDYKAAANWYFTAAVQGNSMAQHAVGALYGNGFGVEKNNHIANFGFNYPVITDTSQRLRH